MTGYGGVHLAVLSVLLGLSTTKSVLLRRRFGVRTRLWGPGSWRNGAAFALTLGWALETVRVAPRPGDGTSWPGQLFTPGPTGILLGTLLMLTGLVLHLLAHRELGLSWRLGADRPERLVTKGIYSRTRNPIYSGFLLLFGGTLAAYGTLPHLILFALAIPVYHALVLQEERLLAARFGQAYRAYQARVPRYGWARGIWRKNGEAEAGSEKEAAEVERIGLDPEAEARQCSSCQSKGAMVAEPPEATAPKTPAPRSPEAPVSGRARSSSGVAAPGIVDPPGRSGKDTVRGYLVQNERGNRGEILGTSVSESLEHKEGRPSFHPLPGVRPNWASGGNPPRCYPQELLFGAHLPQEGGGERLGIGAVGALQSAFVLFPPEGTRASVAPSGAKYRP